MFTRRSTQTRTILAATVLGVASLALAASQADAQEYYNGGNAGQSTTFAGECCQPVLPSDCCCPPQQYTPAAVYPQQYTAPQQYAAPQAVPVQPQYGVGQSQFSYRPLLPIAPQQPVVEVGRGILGQPTVYIPGQPVRNLFRYITPF